MKQEIPDQKELDKRFQGLSLRKLTAIRSVGLLQKLAIARAKKGIQELYIKHQEQIEKVIDGMEDIIKSEEEKLHPQLVSIICSNLIAPFDDEKQQAIVLEMTRMTLEEINKEVQKTEDTSKGKV